MDISLAIGDYEHVRYLASGRVSVPGAKLSVQYHDHPSVLFHRQFTYEEWDVSEFGLAPYSMMIGHGEHRFVGIPVFPSRRFRHSAIYVSEASKLADPSELNGCRIGIPEWAQTAGVYARGMLAEEYGVSLTSITWYQGGVNVAGRFERQPDRLSLPPGINILSVREKPLWEMLQSGELDAIITARPPQSFMKPGGCRYLFQNLGAAEVEYWERTGVFPIMHLVVIRRPVYEEHPWLAKNLVDAFTEAKDISLQRLKSGGTLVYPLPLLTEYSKDMDRIFGADWWPYGLESNRVALDAFLRYAFTQGLMPQQLKADELFIASAVNEYRG